MMTVWNASVRFTRIKLCEFEALDPAYEACQLGADALGFHVFRNQAVDEKLARFREIYRYLPTSVNKVLLTDLDFEPMVLALAALSSDTVQLYPDWPPEQIAALRARARPGLRILKVMSAQPEENRIVDPRAFLRIYGEVVDGFLLDSYRAGGTGKTADWGQCAAVVRATPLPVFLAGGLTADNVGAAIQRIRPFGVDVENGVSDRIPGGPLVKNMAKCARFIEAVRRADADLQRTG
jgi:phosphoribosylanthranilate isomerase